MGSDAENFKYRASLFSQRFVEYFCIVLSRYRNAISLGRKDKDPPNELVDGFGWVAGGVFGTIAGILTAGIGIPVAIGAAASGGGKLGSMGSNYLHNKFSYSKRAKTFVNVVNRGTRQESQYFDATKEKRLLMDTLVQAALHITKIYESQFMEIVEDNIQQSLNKLAADAACRAVNYIVEHSSEFKNLSYEILVKGVLLGHSKKSKTAKLTYYFGQGGHTVKTATNTWNTAKLFDDIAVLATYIYVKSNISLDKSMGARLPADLPDFELSGSWLLQNGFKRYDWTMEKYHSYVTSDETLTEIGEQVIQQFEKIDWELRFDKIDCQFVELIGNVGDANKNLEDLKNGISEINAKTLTEKEKETILRFVKIDLESEFKVLGAQMGVANENLQDIKSEISEINAKVSSTVPSRKLSFKPVSAPHAAFTGRDHFLNSAVEYLRTIEQPNSADLDIQGPCLVIHALGGYGKTQTARKIVSNCRKNELFQHFIWIDSCDKNSIFGSFLEVMKQALVVPSEFKSLDASNIQLHLHNFYDLLVTTENQRFLLIFDNVEDFEQILDFLPLNYAKPLAQPNIAVLMTSQRQCHIFERYGNVKNESLDLILPEEAITLVEKVLGKSSMDSEVEKKQLVERSGRIPLILHLMVSIIKFQRKYKPQYKIEMFLQEPIQFIDQSNKNDLGYEKCLSEIVKIAIDKLNSIAGPIGQIAAQIFDRLAYCSPTGNLSRRLQSVQRTKRPRGYSRIVYQSPCLIGGCLIDIEKEADKLEHTLLLEKDGLRIIQLAVELLSEFSLIQFSDMRYVVHRLVQASRRLNLKHAGLEKNVLNNLMNTLPNTITNNLMIYDDNILSIWYHAADYADLISEYYSVKGTFIAFMKLKAFDLVQKIIKNNGFDRFAKNFIAEHDGLNNPMTMAIKTRNLDMIDIHIKITQWCKTNEPKVFEEWSKKRHPVIIIAINFSTVSVVKQLVEIFNVDLSESSEYLVSDNPCRKLDVILWVMKRVEESQPDFHFNELIEESNGRNLMLCLLCCHDPQVSVETVQILFDKGFDPAYRDNVGNNALHHAVKENNLLVIDLILSRYPVLLESKNNFGRTPLMSAARNKSCEATKHLLEKYSVEINATDSEGFTALTHAIMLRNSSMVNIVLSYGAKTSTTIKLHPTMYALHLAVRALSDNGQAFTPSYTPDLVAPIVDAVLRTVLASSDRDEVNATDTDGNNVLHLLTKHYYYGLEHGPDHLILWSILAANPMFVYIKNYDGFTPLELAKQLLKEDVYNFRRDAENLSGLISQLDTLSVNLD